MFHVYTAGRDYRPATYWGAMLDPYTLYVRAVVVAETGEQAEQLLHDKNAGLYAESLKDAGPDDGPANAVLHYANQHSPHEPSAYLIVRMDRSRDGERYPFLRVYIYELNDTGIRPTGRIRVVSMGRPTAPEPVIRVVPDDDQDDPVPLPARREGPHPETGLVSPVVPFPPGELGDKARLADERLPLGIASVRDQLTHLLADLETFRVSVDPREACDRGSAKLMGLAQKLSRLHEDADLVESALRFGK